MASAKTTLAFVTASLIALSAAGAELSTEQTLELARRSCDLELATTTLAGLRTQDATAGDGTRALLEARAALLVSELLRAEYERTPQDRREQRLQLGRRIDVAADEGLQALELAPENAESWRLRADFLATKIRSKLRAKKLGDEMRKAAAAALELAPDDPHVLATAAKPLVFAPPDHGADFGRALDLLNRALMQNPDLAEALYLRAVTLSLLGEAERAAADRAELAHRRPACPPPPALPPPAEAAAAHDSTMYER